jgi:hypothetical protein
MSRNLSLVYGQADRLASPYTFQPKQMKKLLVGHLWQKIVQRIICRFVHKIARVDRPIHEKPLSRTKHGSDKFFIDSAM